jgi:hypothetical protein
VIKRRLMPRGQLCSSNGKLTRPAKMDEMTAAADDPPSLRGVRYSGKDDLQLVKE